MRPLLLLVLFFLLDLGSFSYGDVDHALQSDLFSTRRHISWWHSLLPLRSSQRARQVPNVPAFSSSMPPAVWASKPSLAPSPAPAPSPMHHGYATGPRGSRHQRRTPNAAPPNAFIPWRNEGCDEVNCPDSQTPTPIGSPCGCVLPMQVELDLGVTPYVIFPLIPELEVEVAKGTYLKQSQVRIMGASADLQDQDKTVVNIFLVPLGEKFDNTTALLIYERFSRRKIPLNATLFGDYDVISIQYPGLPATPPSGNRSSGSDVFPITANVHGKFHRMNSRTIAIVVLALFALLLVCFAITYVLIKWMKTRGSSTMVRPMFTSSITKRSGIESFLSSSFPSLATPSLISTMAPCMLSVKTFLLSELEKATDKFSSKRFLGKGGFGAVYHGIMEDGTEIAVKKLLMREDQNRDREFIAEVEMLSRLHHRNLVKLIGICIDERIRCVVYELVRNGSVESHLHGSDKRRGSLDWDTRMKIALGAARALAYLHEDSNPRVIHRDFKASNVLLENDFTPKVSDFGLAREASEEGQHISTRVMGTFGYVAPEYAMTGHLLVKSDVYSYGVVLLELLSGREPVDMSQPQGQENLVMWARPLLTSQEGIEQLVDPSLGGNYDFDNLARVAAIASMCVHPEVTQRPFMGEVVQALKLIYNDGGEACVDCNSQREGSSVPDCEYRGEVGTDSGWWHGSTPRLTHGYASSFITMDYSSGPMQEIDRPHSASTIVGPRQNRSGPLRAKKMNSLFYRLRGSMSEHGLLSRRFEMDGYWV